MQGVVGLFPKDPQTGQKAFGRPEVGGLARRTLMKQQLLGGSWYLITQLYLYFTRPLKGLVSGL